ncbi:hypothetical protein FJTKL_07671 [Diaporthe vaccinii]|uniref:Uncharacterized protein n=1 Tax=Diaporthe vaccinii TaxID=105482 RepID=A0ABR4ETB0_9PEZI
MLQYYQTIPPRERGGWGCSTPNPGRKPVITRSGPSFFKPKSKPLPLLPPACVRSQPVADIRQPTASCVPARTHSRALVRVSALRAMPRLALPLSLSLSLLLPSSLVSAFQPSRAKCVTKSAERNAPCPKFTSVGIPFFSVSFSPDP